MHIVYTIMCLIGRQCRIHMRIAICFLEYLDISYINVITEF